MTIVELESKTSKRKNDDKKDTIGTRCCDGTAVGCVVRTTDRADAHGRFSWHFCTKEQSDLSGYPEIQCRRGDPF